MDSPCPVGFSKPEFYLLFLFLFLFHQLPYALSYPEPLHCDTLFQCGNITAGFPFWGENRPEHCGHPWLKLECDKGSNKTTLFLFGVWYYALQIDNTSNTLKLARKDFSDDVCSYELADTAVFPPLFEYLPGYKNLTVFYGCNPHLQYLQNFTCPLSGFGSAYPNPEYYKSCFKHVNVTVPASFVLGKESWDLDDLKSVLKEGFWVKPKIDKKLCEECLSPGGTCDFGYTRQFCCLSNSSLGSECHSESPAAGINWSQKIITGVTTSVTMMIILLLVLAYKIFSWTDERENDPSKQNLEALIPLKRYGYAEIKKFTRSFMHIVGRGGFGTVYRGKLPDGCSVAVKVLKESKSNGEEFINEVASMSKTSHVNIVSLLGFCYEGSKRAIIYEFVENGSLDKFISSNNSLNMDWRTLYEIALGVAHGLEYLHYGCKTRIVHFDIKPQNILLDGNLCPKVSDFGLAKLCEKKESIMSLLDARGTFGYVAPEVFFRSYGSVSHKSDVYSYGMLVLEMTGARNNDRAGNSVSNSSSMYFPDWIYKDLERGENTRLLGDQVTEEWEIHRKMVLVGLWCIQTNPSDRPSMSKVVEMMEGSTKAIHVPPKPLLSCPTTIALPESVEENSTSPEPSQIDVSVPVS